MSRKKIAVFISALYEDMVQETVEGLLSAARGRDEKLIFFTSFADNHTSQNYDRYQDYDIGDFVVYLLPDLKEYDALVTFDQYMTGSFIEPINRLKRAAPCPVITLGSVKAGTYSIANDQDLSYAELIEHVINEHGCRDLVHITGQKERSFCIERIEIFRNTLTARGLPCGEDRIYHGTLRPECGEDIVPQILADYAAKGGKSLPDAIICVNDYTAIGVIKALKDRGFQVPQDVIVTGYDDILRAQFNDPSITTSAQPFFRVGQAGMETLIRLLNGETESRFAWFFETPDLYGDDFGKKYISKIQIQLQAAEDMQAEVYAQFKRDGAWVLLKRLHFEPRRHVTAPVPVRRSDYLRLRVEGSGEMVIGGLQIDFAGGSDKTWRF